MPTNDNLKQVRFSIPFFCRCCSTVEEDAQQIFLRCSYDRQFGPTLEEFLENLWIRYPKLFLRYLRWHFLPAGFDIVALCSYLCFWAHLAYEKSNNFWISLHHGYKDYLIHCWFLRLVNQLDIGGMHNKQSELLILRTFWLDCHLQPAPLYQGGVVISSASRMDKDQYRRLDGWFA